MGLFKLGKKAIASGMRLGLKKMGGGLRLGHKKVCPFITPSGND